MGELFQLTKFIMDLGKEGEFSFSLMLGTCVRWRFLNRFVVLTKKEKVRLSSKAMAAICARILDLDAFRTLGLSRILRSSLIVLLDRSDAERAF